MPFINIPVFVAREILLASKLNQLGSALSGFSATGADITWPLVAGGHIDMDRQYEILRLRTFWTIINAREYDSVQDAVDAASAGTCVFFDAGEDFDSAAITITDSNIALVGCGPESTLKLKAAGAGPLIRIGPAVSNIVIANMTLEGAAGAASSHGIEAQQVTNLRLENLSFVGFKGTPIRLVNDGTAGTSCVDCQIINCQDTTSTGNAIFVNDVDGLVIDRYRSEIPGADGINIEADGAASIIRDIQITNCRIEGPIGKGIYVAGNSGTADAKWSRVSISNCKVVDPADDGIQLGDTAKIIQSGEITGCQIEGAVGADGFVANIQGGQISGCTARAAVGDGLDILDSVDLHVHGCNFQDATLNGIDASSVPDNSDCSIQACNVRDAGTEGIAKPSGGPSGLECVANIGDVNKSAYATHAENPGTSNVTGGGAEILISTYTIPANTLTKSGDGLRVVVRGESATSTMTMLVRLSGQELGRIVVGATGTSGVLVCDSWINSAGPNGASNFSTIYHGIDETSAQAGEASLVTVDFTVDQDITIKGVSVTGTASISAWKLELTGGDHA